MALSDENALRALIRLIPPAQALRDDLEKSLHLDTYNGTGDLAIQSFAGLRDSVLAVTNDPYVGALNVTAKPDATDQEKVSLARLAAGQLAAYLEGQTGLSGSGSGGSGGGNVNIQRAPMVNMVNVSGAPAEVMTKLSDMVTKDTPAE